LLEDREEIRDLIERNGEAADHHNDPDLMSGLFAENAVWEAPGFGRFEGFTAILNGRSEIGTTRLIWTMHYMISPHDLSTNSNHQCGSHRRPSIMARLGARNSTREAPQPEAVWGGVSYQVDLARIAGKWQFTHVRLKLELITRYTDGWATTRLAQL
jgi:SnoaL-like protein